MLRKAIKAAERDIDTKGLPEGRLRISNAGGRQRYYFVKSSESPAERYTLTLLTLPGSKECLRKCFCESVLYCFIDLRGVLSKEQALISGFVFASKQRHPGFCLLAT
ncbi:MAG: hypothetical protein J6U10_09350, partial [Lachnospiraceae bacterium]|nr:hypothetical protein [Lachnospiraceae bacterium]